MNQLREIVDLEKRLHAYTIESLPLDLLRECKRSGFSDQNVSEFLAPSNGDNRLRESGDGSPPQMRVSILSTKEWIPARRNLNRTRPISIPPTKANARRTLPDKKKIMVLGSGPNRIGQGIEFDYCCCHASFALKEAGFETIMVNCNPETVSTDYDTSDRLYFEPLTFEDVMEIVAVEKPHGVIVQFGGQTPLNLALRLKEAGVPIIGTSPENIDLAEDRKRFGQLLVGSRHSATAKWNGPLPGRCAGRRAANRVSRPRPSFLCPGRPRHVDRL